MVFIFYLVLIFFVPIYNEQWGEKKNFTKNTFNSTNKILENNINNITVKKRKLGEFSPIRISVNLAKIISQLEEEKLYNETDLLISSINRAVETIEKIFEVEKLDNGVDVSSLSQSSFLNYGLSYNDLSFYKPTNQFDLIIFIRRAVSGENFNRKDQFAKPDIIGTNAKDGRPTIGYIVVNFNFITNMMNEDNTTKYEFYSSYFLHEIIHILGFMEDIFNSYSNYGSIFKDKTIKRLGITKRIVKSSKILELAKEYFNDTGIEGLELEEEYNSEGLRYSHWNGRLLLGDIMTSNIYYQEQVISEFTLALLEESGWYKINYFTGGLMRFGKGKKNSFINNDCLKKENDIFSSLFTNEFCTQSYGSCSSGRLSRGYCSTKAHLGEGVSVTSDKSRNMFSDSFHGALYVEYCPVSNDTLSLTNNYYIGNCKIGNQSFGSEMDFLNEKNYTIFNQLIGEKYGSNSFCALSSIIDKKYSNQIYKGFVRPTCYSMFCSNRSLTIEINDEYIVCPREGGMIKIGKNNNSNYTKYTGYLFCPDYNLICTGSVMCNNMFDCVNNNSTYKKGNYDYQINNVINGITSDIRNESQLNILIPTENYELSTDINAKCPVNCSQCISNKRCTLCRNFTKNEPHAYYIGEKDNEESYINCSETKPKGGYYNITRYDSKHIHYFRCVENCNVCLGPVECEQCLPEYKKNRTDKSCYERIPNCKQYNKTSNFTDYEDNGGGEGYKLCEQCDNDNGYYCLDLNKTICIKVDDYSDHNYYEMEDVINPCIQKCDVKFNYCLKCFINGCTSCKPEFKVNSTGYCEERIPHCIIYDNSTGYNDTKTNGGLIGYRECKQCDKNLSYYCINNDRTNCKYVNPNDLQYYYNQTNSFCINKCNDKFKYCLKCKEEECTHCIVDFSKNGSCYKPIDNCIEYEIHQENNDDYADCKKCDKENSYYCLNDNRASCEKINIVNDNYFKINENDEYSCVRKCEDTFQECISCNNSYCFECKENFVVSNKNKTQCLFQIRPPDDDECTVLIHDIDEDINSFEFEDLIDYYFINTLPYTKHVEHFIGKNYTVTLFIYSECTEELLTQNYFKIDSKELYNEMYNKAEIESNELLFSFFVTYNYQNHYRFYNVYTQYLNETKICPNCIDIPFTITNRFTGVISEILGPIISSLIVSENVNIFYNDTDVFNDYCFNLTIKKIDIPLKERLYYLYLHNYSTPIACSGKDCEIEEINIKEGISVCKCKMGKYKDILDPIIIKYTNYDYKNINPSDSISDIIGIIKCVKNGLNKHNILANGGAFISIIAIIADLVLFIFYCLCSKVIKLEKGSNPPPKIKKKILLYFDWKNNRENSSPENIDSEHDLIQSRDEDDGYLVEEDITFSNRNDNMSSFSIDTNIGLKIKMKNKDKDKDINNILKKNRKRILVLLPDKKGNKKRKLGKNSDLNSEVEFIPLERAKKKDKRSFCRIYWSIVSIKQHIINLFSCIKCCKITESYLPLPIRLIRSIFIIIIPFILNLLFLNQDYFSKKFKYFNEEYKILAVYTNEIQIKVDEITDGTIPSGEIIAYTLSHTIINAIIVFLIMIVVQFIVGCIFFNIRKNVIEIIRENDLDGVQNLVLKTRIKYIIFFILSIVLLLIFLFTFVGFGGAYGGGFIDYFVPGIISLILLELFPFLWSLILTLFRYLGIKKENKCCYEFSQFFIF